jgi:hypothetical protein
LWFRSILFLVTMFVMYMFNDQDRPRQGRGPLGLRTQHPTAYPLSSLYRSLLHTTTTSTRHGCRAYSTPTTHATLKHANARHTSRGAQSPQADGPSLQASEGAAKKDALLLYCLRRGLKRQHHLQSPSALGYRSKGEIAVAMYAVEVGRMTPVFGLRLR